MTSKCVARALHRSRQAIYVSVDLDEKHYDIATRNQVRCRLRGSMLTR